MGAWCSVGSRPDLRHRPRHRCAVGTPAVPRRRPPATDVPTSVSQRTVRTMSTTSASKGGRRINDGNCPPVAHRLSRLGRNEFSDAASISAEELRRGVAMPGVITLATAPRGASPRASRRRSRRARYVETARRWPITRWLSSLANLRSEGSRFCPVSIVWRWLR